MKTLTPAQTQLLEARLAADGLLEIWKKIKANEHTQPQCINCEHYKNRDGKLCNNSKPHGRFFDAIFFDGRWEV